VNVHVNVHGPTMGGTSFIFFLSNIHPTAFA